MHRLVLGQTTRSPSQLAHKIVNLHKITKWPSPGEKGHVLLPTKPIPGGNKKVLSKKASGLHGFGGSSGEKAIP